MAIPGTLTYAGPTSVAQSLIDEIPTMHALAAWLGDAIVDEDVGKVSHEASWSESGYEAGGIWFTELTTGFAEALADYGFDLYDQGSDLWYAFLPSDREAT